MCRYYYPFYPETGNLEVVGAVALTLASFGAAGPIIAGACIGGAMAVGITAVGDVIRGEVSSTEEYGFAGLSGAVTGAISGGINLLKLGKVAKVGLEIAEGFITGAAESVASQMMLEGKKWSEINPLAVAFNSFINGGIAMAVPAVTKLGGKIFGKKVVKAIAKEGGQEAIEKATPKILSSQSFNNWDDMKNAYKGNITQFVKDHKPLGSTHPRDWLKNGKELTIDMLDDGTQIWNYTKDNITVPYVPKIVPDGSLQNVIQFPNEFLHTDKNITQFVNLDGFNGNRATDKKWALEYLTKFGYDYVPRGYVLHHDIDNGVFQIVRKDVHKIFSHYGGHYYNK